MHEKIRKELDEVRYYNANRERFQKAEALIGKNRAVYAFEKYNSLIQAASPKLYETYFALYVYGWTYEAAAEEYNYSVNYIYKTNRALIEYFEEALTSCKGEPLALPFLYNLPSYHSILCQEICLPPYIGLGGLTR